MEDAAAPYTAPKQITYENTFITEPEGYGQVKLLLLHNLQHSFAWFVQVFILCVFCSNMSLSDIKCKRC